MSFDDEIRRRREDAIRASRALSPRRVASSGAISPADRRRAFSRWKTGWLAWHANGMDGEGYDELYASLITCRILDELVARYRSRHPDGVHPEPWVGAAHYNAAVHIARRAAGLA